MGLASLDCVTRRTSQWLGWCEPVKQAPSEAVRCAIYTRVSTENGLDQEFNSLDAQHEQSRPLDNEYARSQIERIEIQKHQLLVLMKQEPAAGPATAEATPSIVIPWQRPASKKPRAILMPRSASAKARPIKLERRATLVAAIARGRRWLDEPVAGRSASIEEIAIQSNRSARHVSMTISLAYLSPSLVRAAIEGRLPRGIGVEQLRELPPGWDDQFSSLGQKPGIAAQPRARHRQWLLEGFARNLDSSQLRRGPASACRKCISKSFGCSVNGRHSWKRALCARLPSLRGVSRPTRAKHLFLYPAVQKSAIIGFPCQTRHLAT
jgi:hypothetical protein